jgi:putative transposase
LAAGRKVVDVARDLQISDQTIYTWRRQDLIDRGLRTGSTASENAELAVARKRIAPLEAELAATQRAMELIRGAVPPQERFAAIKQMAGEGHSVQLCCRILAVAESGYYDW